MGALPAVTPGVGAGAGGVKRKDGDVDDDILQQLDPRDLGRRLQDARKASGRTQQDAADQLGVARTTITAIEQGARRVQPGELVRLASYFGRSVGEFMRRGEAVAPFTVQLRAVLSPKDAVEAEIAPGLLDFQRLCEDYLELERLCAAPLPRHYPAPYELGGLPPEALAEDVATAERSRLGLGDGPLLHLREVLENDVGLRIFFIDLPPKVAGMFAYTEQLGGCVALNAKHPPERARLTIAHDYAHFLTKRYQPEITPLGRYERLPEQERFADAFARTFLLPTDGLRRRFHELQRSREGGITPADLCLLAHRYFVSVEAITRRLEELHLVPLGTWDRLVDRGFRVREAQALLHLAPHAVADQPLPLRYRYLAAEAYERGDLSEGQLARFLRTDRLGARELVASLATRATITDEGTVGTVPLDLGERLPSRAT